MEEREIRVGLGGWQFELPDREPRPHSGLYSEFVEDAVLAEELGFDFVLTSEHHFWHDGSCPNPILPLAAAATATSKIRLGTGVLLLPLHDPARVAAQFASLDVISNGRAIAGFGLGYRNEEFAGFGLRRQDRGARMDSALSVVRTSWEGEFADSASEIAMVRPLQKNLPIWIGGHAAAALKRAVRHRCGVLLPPILSDQEVVRIVELFRALEVDAGLKPGTLEIGVHRIVHVVERSSQCADFRRRIERAYYDTYGSWGRFVDDEGRPIGRDRAMLLRSKISEVSANVCCGASDAVANQLMPAVRSGADFLVCKVQVGSMPPDVLRPSLRRLSRYVLPQLKVADAA